MLRLAKRLKFIIGLSFLMLSATSFIKPDRALAVFTSECDDIEVSKPDDREPGNPDKNYRLLADCYATPVRQGMKTATDIVLNKWIGVTADGRLNWIRDGNFEANVTNVSFIVDRRTERTYLVALCRKSDGGTNLSFLDLDAKIYNIYGYLVHLDDL